MGLPVKTTMEDVETIIGYLKNKPTGSTLTDAKAVLSAKPLDPRKLNAYRTWGLVEDSGEKLTLSEQGWEIARNPAKSESVLLGVIDRTRPYRSAIEWAFHQGFAVLSLNDATAFWHSNHKDALGTTSETSIKDAVTCFFNLAQGAGLGAYVLGRRGTATRLELNRGAVSKFIEAGPSVPPWSGPDLASGDEAGADSASEAEVEVTTPPAVELDARPAAPRLTNERLRVFIAHGSNMDIVDQVQTMLDLADIDSEVAEEEETTAIPVPNKVLEAMRRSDAGIICVSADERKKHEDGSYTVNENVLIEIGAAFVLYDQKVILLWDKRLAVPSNLQGLYRCEYEGDEIGWSAGMKMMKAIKNFRA